MSDVRLATCSLCEAMCGIAVTVDGDRVVRIEGDRDDPHSRGHICPKATALGDLHHDAHRLRQPMRREGDAWHAIGWDEAFDLAGRLLGGVQKAHGRDALGFYYGNPTGHSYRALLGFGLSRGLFDTANLFSPASVDQLPRQVASYLLYGNQARLPVPDVDQTEYFLILGANPVVSQGSVMTAPGMKQRLKALRARGGRLVVVDPRRTETAAVADTHVFIRPGFDALFVAAILRAVLEMACPPDLEPLRAALAPFTPDAIAPATGVAPETTRVIAHDFAAAERAVAYGRMGISVAEFGTTCTWLIDALNYATGNLDAPGGAMFSRAAIDLPTLAERLGQQGGYGPATPGGRPTFNHERPTAELAELMESGAIRGFVTHAGNPVLALPDGRRLDAAMARLEGYVAIDPRINETTRHAHLILPPPSPLEKDWYGLVFNAVAVREVAKYVEPVFTSPDAQPDEFTILTRLAAGVARHRGGVGPIVAAGFRLGTAVATPPRLLDLMLRTGPRRLSLKRLKAAPHGLDLGAREGGRLPGTPEMCHPRLMADLDRLADSLDTPAAPLVLIGRRTLRSMNSWLHDSPRMVKGRPRCTARMHPDDAAEHGLTDGQTIAITGNAGTIEVPLEISDEVMRGVVSVPHGWGHGRKGTRRPVAAARPGASVNDAIDASRWDPVSGTTQLNGLPISVRGVASAAG